MKIHGWLDVALFFSLGAAYTEKPATYVNTEGRAQRANVRRYTSGNGRRNVFGLQGMIKTRLSRESRDWSFDWSIDWLVGWSIDWLVGWLMDWLVDWLMDWLVDWLLACLIHWSIDWLFDYCICSAWINQFIPLLFAYHFISILFA